MIEKTALISGAGPCGLAAALMLHRRGWKRIILLERSPSALSFDKNKGFNYLVDARGQKLLKHLGIADRLARYGVANQRNLITIVKPDGSQRTMASPFWDPRRDEAYWIRRERFLALLSDRVEEINDSRIELHYGTVFDGVVQKGAGLQAVGVSKEGQAKHFPADLILGCDGLKSAVRAAMASEPGAEPGAYEQVKFPSPSSELFYKVLQGPAQIQLQGEGAAPCDDNQMGYMFVGRHTDVQKSLALVGYPTASTEEPRTLNIIRLPDHDIWKARSTDELYAFLEDTFPQLPVREVLPQDEAEDFVAEPPPKFPAPQYTKTVHRLFASGDTPVPAVLLGDAAHAFPPDLGLGVNTAMEDVWHLNRHLDACGEDAVAAVHDLDVEQLPERRSLAKLVQTVAPYQYNHLPRQLKIWALKFFAVKGLHKLLPFYIDPPAVLLAQQDELPFSDIRRRQVLNRWKIASLFALICAAGVAPFALGG